ncbi:hypothetical protein O7628_22530 [Micromonospora sp. WMMD956]|uniref:hypothetical protein n=1 Tax=Micromonospora TaxID=1873 RepID=UPI002417A01F|nr:hypothetical protein [Micromonospora sp. WMMD956]MDG4818263.1 hypothetical protein [Micromonospora sp. WMMD956]
MDAITRCSTCKGSGQVGHYIQHCNDVIDRTGRTVARTDCTRYKPCPTCGGSDRSH